MPLLADNHDATRSSAPIDATQSIQDASLKRILDDSGVLPQLAGLTATVIAESRKQWQLCDPPERSVELWLRDTFTSEYITRLAVEELERTLDKATLVSIIQWLDSTNGQTIVQAEHSSAVLSDDEFDRLFGNLSAEPDYHSERAPRIRALLESTRAAEFISILNSELNALVALSVACSPSAETLKRLVDNASTNRQDLDLVTMVMNLNLRAPTAVVYRHVNNEVIDSYLAFAASSVGHKYHDALITTTRTTMITLLTTFAEWRATN